MDFINKYLKYKPEITFDIFQKVWDKLIESGYLPVGKYYVEKGFGDFKTLYSYLRTTKDNPMAFNCHSVIPALFWVETTVQEILGYDPFVRDDDFVLPENWIKNGATPVFDTLKVNSDNTINIKLIKESYTKDELIAFGLKCVNLGMDLNNNPLPRLNEISGKEFYYKWVEENL